MRKINIALVSPNLNAYSETFIQNHRISFEGNVFYYYGGSIPTFLDRKGKLRHSRIDEFIFFIRRLIGRNIDYRLLDSKTLVRSFKENKVDVVYAEYGTTGADLIGVCKEAGVSLITNFHGYDASEQKILQTYQYKYSELFDFASAIVAVSNPMLVKLEELGCSAEKLKYIPCVASEHFLEIEPQYSEKSFISIGRFVDKKAPYYNILAFRKVVDKHPDAILYMAGNGPLFDVCVNLAKKLDLSENVRFLGIVTHSDILNYLAKVKGFIQHSITPSSGDMEGTPVAVLEASASALPVISTRHAGIPDVIIENETGFLVDEHDVDGMAEYMIRILDEDGLAQRMGEKGRKNIKENFNLQQHINTLNEVIEQSIR